MVRYSFPVGLFHSLLHAGLIPAHAHCWHTIESGGGWLNVLERVENPNVEAFEVSFIPCGNNQMMHACGGSDHGIFQQFVGFSVDDASPLSKTHGVHR